MEDLETARAILEAKLVGKAVQPDEQVADSVINAMSLIAGEYQSDSEEEGEVDHDDLKQTFIDEKIKELAEQVEKKKSSSATSDAGDDVQIVGYENGSGDKDVEFISETLLPAKQEKSKEKERKPKKSRDKSPKRRSVSRERKRNKSKTPPKRRKSPSPKQARSPKRAKRSRSRDRDRDKENKSAKRETQSKTNSTKTDKQKESSRGREREETSRSTRRSPRYFEFK